MNGHTVEFRICSEWQTKQTEYHVTAKEGGVRAPRQITFQKLIVEELIIKIQKSFNFSSR